MFLNWHKDQAKFISVASVDECSTVNLEWLAKVIRLHLFKLSLNCCDLGHALSGNPDRLYRHSNDVS
jgi:hypothetical protein